MVVNVCAAPGIVPKTPWRIMTFSDAAVHRPLGWERYFLRRRLQMCETECLTRKDPKRRNFASL